MKLNQRLLIRIAAILVVLIIAVLMFIIGRGHTVYFDNKVLEYNGKTYECPYKVEAFVHNKNVAKLYVRERGMAEWMGQNFTMTLTVTQKKGGDEVTSDFSFKLPYNMDGVVVNLPGLLAGLPPEAYLEEFVSLATEETVEEEPITDELDGLTEPLN